MGQYKYRCNKSWTLVQLCTRHTTCRQSQIYYMAPMEKPGV